MCDIWIDYCLYFFTYVDEEDFILSNENKELSKEVYKYNFRYIFEKNKVNINKFFSVEKEDLEGFIERIKID